jgi:hypothetical protein
VPLDADAGNVELYAGSSLPSLFAIAAIALAIDPLVNHFVAGALVEATGAADVPAADFTAHARDRFRQAELVGPAQAGCASEGSGIRLTKGCA